MASMGVLKPAAGQLIQFGRSSLLQRTSVPATSCASRPLHSLVSQQAPQRSPRRAPRFTPSKASRTPVKRYSSGSSWLLSALPNLASSSAPQTIHASRVLPYPPSQVYTLIADVSAYRTFLPHCSSSLVRAWASPPAAAESQQQDQIRAPALADLTVGWGPFTETYTSRVYCVPPGKAKPDEGGIGIVEAVSGKAATTITAEVLQPLGYDGAKLRQNAAMPSVESGIFESLVTRWTVRPTTASTGVESSDVTLTVKFQFANAILGQAVGQLAKEKADEMIEAFESRARQLYGRK